MADDGSNGVEGDVPQFQIEMRAGSRFHFASQHLWMARHMARLCQEREDALAAEGFRGVDMAHRSLVVAAVFDAVAFLEALVNEVWDETVEILPNQKNFHRVTGLQRTVVDRMRELWQSPKIERALSLLDKYRVALVCADQPPLGAGAEPYQSVHALIKLRNELVHFKPETHWDDEVHELETLIKPRIAPNAIYHGWPFFPNGLLCAGCARWACESAVDFAKRWWERMGLERDFLTDFKTWPEP